MQSQQAVSDAQRALTRAEHGLDALLARQAASGGTGATTSSGPSAGSRSTATTGPTAADLASYQRAVDGAAAAVAVAGQALQQGTIVSPIAGTVTAVDLTVGQTVGAASTTAGVLITGPGGFEVSTALSVADVPHVAPGAPTTVVPDGDHRAYRGKVVSVSALPSSVTSVATDYLVVVALDDPNAPLTNGDLAAVTIVTTRAPDVLSVPTSAVTVIGNRHLVEVLRPDGAPHTVTVGVGAVGADRTQVTSGLHAGDRVLLADLSTPLPGSATSASNGTTGTAASRIQGLLRGAGGGNRGGFGGFGGFGGGGGGAGRPGD
jgi:RND family efflux transporter MFP subunit